jgi:hypothetical protein
VIHCFDHSISFKEAGAAREIGLENTLTQNPFQLDYSLLQRELPIKSIVASTYLRTVQPYLSHLVSQENFKDILSLSRYFPGNMTSFLGFECRLGEPETRADWAFAISGVGGDRRVFAHLLQSGFFPDYLLEQPEWNSIARFAHLWVDKESMVNAKVKCFWLEFDMPSSRSSELPIPRVFFGPSLVPTGTSSNDASQYQWLTDLALPALKGQPLTETMEGNIQECIHQLPANAMLFQVGTTLSPSPTDVRLYINRLAPSQIVPYLKSLDWADGSLALARLVQELKNHADRFVLSYDVTENGIGSRIGIECSFTPNRFHKERRWSNLLDFLVQKQVCLPEKRDALLHYPGVEEDAFAGEVKAPLVTASKILGDLRSSVLVRYINHVKLVYQPGLPLEAKAYPAVRLFERPYKTTMKYDKIEKAVSHCT